MLQLSSFHSSSTKVLVTNDNIVPCSIFNGKLRWLFKIAQRIFELANTSSREGENISAAAHSFWPHGLKKILSLNSHFWFYLGEGLGTWIQNSKLRGKLSLVWSDSCSLGVLSRSPADLHRAGGMTVSWKMITFFIWRSWNLICREFCRWVDYSDVWHEQPQSFARSFKKKLIDFKLSIFLSFSYQGGSYCKYQWNSSFRLFRNPLVIHPRRICLKKSGYEVLQIQWYYSWGIRLTEKSI